MRVIKEFRKSGEPLFAYMFQEKVPFKAKVGPRKKDAYMETSVWMVVSTKPVKDYQKLNWRDACEKSISPEGGSNSKNG